MHGVQDPIANELVLIIAYFVTADISCNSNKNFGTSSKLKFAKIGKESMVAFFVLIVIMEVNSS